MKQNISITDLNELSDTGKERLREWWDKKLPYESAKNLTETSQWLSEQVGNMVKLKHLPLLSIGQLIEFLLDHGENLRDRFYMREDFCDELWGDVKEILEAK